jgi:hypothetical protein
VDRFRRPFSLVLFLLLRSFCWAQDGAASSAASLSLPTDPVQFLKLAAKVNGLASDTIGPWHVRATFQVLDNDGKVQESGVYEAFWKSPNKYKMIYSSPSYNRTIWAGDSGNFATTNLKWPGEVEWMIRRSLFDLTPEPGNSERWEMHTGKTANGIKLNCFELQSESARWGPRGLPSYCFDIGAPALRFGSESRQFYQGTFNNIAVINGAYVARDVQLMHAGRPYFRIHVDTLEALPNAKDELFRADLNAVHVPRRIVIDTDLRDIHAVYKVGPACCYLSPPNSINPSMREQENPILEQRSLMRQEQSLMYSEGLPMYDRAVIVQVLVNKRGKIADARPITGDLRAQFLALSAARKWEFKPYIVEGEPTEFYTELEFF